MRHFSEAEAKGLVGKAVRAKRVLTTVHGTSIPRGTRGDVFASNKLLLSQEEYGVAADFGCGKIQLEKPHWDESVEVLEP